MDRMKTGALIRKLRKEKNLKQSDLAQALNVSNKTISKWECAAGCPDISSLIDLSEYFGIDLFHMLKGDCDLNDSTGGNMKNTRFYICPVCGNLSISTGSARMVCCGRNIEEHSPKKAGEDEKLTVQENGGEWYITSTHPMDKDDYISFVAFLNGGSANLYRLYPEWDLNLNIPKQGHGKLVWLSTTKGLFYQLL